MTALVLESYLWIIVVGAIHHSRVCFAYATAG